MKQDLLQRRLSPGGAETEGQKGAYRCGPTGIQQRTGRASRTNDRGHSAVADLLAAANLIPGVHEAPNEARPEADKDRARSHFHEAMASIPHGDRVAHGEAMERAPRLVDVESNPDHYLELAEFDPWKAAARVAAYWKARVEIFGGRAFLPMTISGEGAMLREDIELLQSGFLMVLPNDKQGHPVVS